MGKISKSVKVAKALVKRGISKATSRPEEQSVPDSETVKYNRSEAVSKPSLKEMSEMIATAPISRGKRKRAIKRARLEGRKAFAAMAVAAKKSADDVRGFGEALGSFQDMFNAIDSSDHSKVTESSAVSSTPVVPKKKGGALKRNQKEKSDLVDIQRVQALFQIPEFSADPLSAIEKHLVNLKAKREIADQKNPNRMEIS